MKFLRSSYVQITAVLMLAAAWKMVFVFWDVIPFNSDEAVVALMARHILLGERPIFFYGQAYMGSLDAFLVAAGFLLFGQQVWVIRLVQGILYLAFLLVTMWIGKEAFGDLRAGILAALLLAIPTVNVTLYTTVSLGGYGEALLIGGLAVLLALKIMKHRLSPGSEKPPLAALSFWGALVGFGLWANGLSLVYSAPAAVYLLWGIWKHNRRWLPAFFLTSGAGFFLGSLPWWIYLAGNGPQQLILELFGTAIAVERMPWLARTGAHLVNFLLLGVSAIFGFRPPWNVQWLALPLLPFVLIFWMGVLWFFTRGLRRSGVDNLSGGQKTSPGSGQFYVETVLLAGICAAFLAGFLFTPFGADPSGRYFLPLALPLTLIAARMILHIARKPWLVAALTVLVIGYQAWGTLQCAQTFPPGLTTQFHEPTIIDHRADGELIAFLREQGETRGYTNYWVAYPLAFQSSEELIFIPRLPYHVDLRYTPRDDRYAPYTQIVAESQHTAFITMRSPPLDQYLRAEFSRLGVSWQEKTIADYKIYYRLSRAVRPNEIGLGDLQE